MLIENFVRETFRKKLFSHFSFVGQTKEDVVGFDDLKTILLTNGLDRTWVLNLGSVLTGFGFR